MENFSSQYLASQIMSDDISEGNYTIHRLEAEYFHANDRLAFRDEVTSLKFRADRSDVSIIANWEVTRL
jgi:hypothetical protein